MSSVIDFSIDLIRSISSHLDRKSNILNNPIKFQKGVKQIINFGLNRDLYLLITDFNVYVNNQKLDIELKNDDIISNQLQIYKYQTFLLVIYKNKLMIFYPISISVPIKKYVADVKVELSDFTIITRDIIQNDRYIEFSRTIIFKDYDITKIYKNLIITSGDNIFPFDMFTNYFNQYYAKFVETYRDISVYSYQFKSSLFTKYMVFVYKTRGSLIPLFYCYYNESLLRTPDDIIQSQNFDLTDLQTKNIRVRPNKFVDNHIIYDDIDFDYIQNMYNRDALIYLSRKIEQKIHINSRM